MKIYRTEEEQLGEIRQFFQKYGKIVVISIVLSFSAVIGWRYWQQHQVSTNMESSEIYEKLLKEMNSVDNSAALIEATHFVNQNNTTYAVFTAMQLAKQYVKAENYSEAQKVLELALTKTKDQELLATLNIRIARLLFQQQQPEQALIRLDLIKLKSWSALINDLKGDIYNSQQQYAEACNAYQLALSSEPNESKLQELIKIKLNEAEYMKATHVKEEPKTEAEAEAQ